MSVHVAAARRRESVFDALVGQDAVASVLAAAAAGDGMTHAWLFTGPPGSGRSVAARAFAAALLCPTRGCGTCDSCRAVRAGSSPNVVLVNPDTLSIGVGDVKDLLRRFAYAPAGGGVRVAVVEDADRLTEAAANACLKAIEEPEPGGVFLLCAPSPEDLPPTIRSRCRHVGLRLPSAVDVAGVLTRSGVPADLAAWAAAAAQGHVGRARALATDEEARTQRERALALPARAASVGEALAAAADLVESTRTEADRVTKAVSEAETGEFAEVLGGTRGAKGAMAELARRQKSRETRARRDLLDRALVDLAAYFRDVLVRQLGADVPAVHADVADAVARTAASSTPEVTMRRVEAVLACREAVAANVDPLLAVESMALALRP